jgi:hypothetical protein
VDRRSRLVEVAVLVAVLALIGGISATKGLDRDESGLLGVPRDDYEPYDYGIDDPYAYEDEEDADDDYAIDDLDPGDFEPDDFGASVDEIQSDGYGALLTLVEPDRRTVVFEDGTVVQVDRSEDRVPTSSYTSWTLSSDGVDQLLEGVVESGTVDLDSGPDGDLAPGVTLHWSDGYDDQTTAEVASSIVDPITDPEFWGEDDLEIAEEPWTPDVLPIEATPVAGEQGLAQPVPWPLEDTIESWGYPVDDGDEDTLLLCLYDDDAGELWGALSGRDLTSFGLQDEETTYTATVPEDFPAGLYGYADC